ncbi:hypothetical protein B6I21_05985 [candidate division KSB1 bacterium 4572_119]|nr:MAG: hypothetical protein B6I21_05985 [candidate division KSB1 bacterium 4572_119]
MSKRIFKNLFDLATGTFVSRVFGFVRELVTAAFYGTNRAMDLFVIAFTIPAFFRQVLGEDVVERAFMPPFKKLISQRQYKKGWELLSSCLNLMIFLLIILTIILYFLAPLIVKLLAPGLAADLFPIAVKMTYWILPFMFIIGMAAFAGGILNFFEMNKIYALLEFVIQVPFLFKKKIRADTQASYTPTFNYKEKEMRKVGRESGFILLKSLLDKSVEIVDRVLASFLITGSIASLWFAHRLILLPVAIIGLAISRSIIPYLTEKQALVESEKFLSGIRLGIQLNFILVLPTIMLMVVLAEPIISLVYQRGSFDSESTRLTTIAFWCYSIGLLGLSMNAFLSRLFSIFQKNKIPFYVAIFSSALNIALNFILVKTPLKHGGIALASSIAFTVSFLILFYLMLKEIKYKIRAGSIFFDFMKTGFICLIVGAISYYFYQNFVVIHLSQYALSLFMKNLISLILVSMVGFILYGGLFYLFSPVEMKERLKKVLMKGK